MTFTYTSQADVTTDRPDRYSKQLVAHLGRKLETREEDAGSRVVFERGDCLLVATGGVLQLRAGAADEETLAVVEDVVARHLEKFGARDELTVRWTRGASDAS